MFGNDFPEWALDEALSRFPNPYFVSGEPWKKRILEGVDAPYADGVRVLARQIAKYCNPPSAPMRRVITEIVEAALSDVCCDEESAIEHAIKVAKVVLPPAAIAAIEAD